MTWRMRPALVAALFAGAVVAAALALTLDGPGRLLVGGLAFAALAEAVRGLRPTLTADADGVSVATLAGHEWNDWRAVVHVGTMAPPSSGRRLRRSANALEIDLGERLLVVGGYRLGANVTDVAASLESMRATSRSVS
jgi:hypothetical protein